MSANGPAGGDKMPALEGGGDHSAGMPNFNVRELAGIFGATAKMFAGAEQTVAQNFGASSELLPFTNNQNLQV